MNVITVPIDKEKAGNRYRLVIAVAKRARDLYRGAVPKVEVKNKKLTTVALEEILTGEAQVLSGEDSRARIAAMKRESENMIDEAAQKKLLDEGATRLEKLMRDLFGKETISRDEDFSL